MTGLDKINRQLHDALKHLEHTQAVLLDGSVWILPIKADSDDALSESEIQTIYWNYDPEVPDESFCEVVEDHFDDVNDELRMQLVEYLLDFVEDAESQKIIEEETYGSDFDYVDDWVCENVYSDFPYDHFLEQMEDVFPLITAEMQKSYEGAVLNVPRACGGNPSTEQWIPEICGVFGRACRQMDRKEGADRAICQGCSLSEFAKRQIVSGHGADN